VSESGAAIKQVSRRIESYWTKRSRKQMDRLQKLFDAAIAAEEAGQSAKALRLYEKASDINPAAYPIGLRWASLLYDEGRWRDAIRVAVK